MKWAILFSVLGIAGGTVGVGVTMSGTVTFACDTQGRTVVLVPIVIGYIAMRPAEGDLTDPRCERMINSRETVHDDST